MQYNKYLTTVRCLDNVLMMSVFWSIRMNEVANKQHKNHSPKWLAGSGTGIGELFLFISLFHVWPRSTVTQSSPLATWLLSSASDVSRAIWQDHSEFLNHHSGSVWWAWSQLPQEGRQTWLKDSRDWVLLPKRCHLGRKVMTHWHSRVWETYSIILFGDEGPHGCMQICFLSLVLHLLRFKWKRWRACSLCLPCVIFCSSRYPADGMLLTLQLPFSIVICKGNRIKICRDTTALQWGNTTWITTSS